MVEQLEWYHGIFSSRLFFIFKEKTRVFYFFKEELA
ncbi:hypothetical protein N784_13755 [Pontibacillus litoralis JSM 072002]|uniref:Uncharacterized protein n=1 Tax=Pontibacillus litoralis JSM 072002 TaxID=1385512 RepID=A0A0A5FZQ7_9BACI|nr:hypothetical protein N784_13755 [Pontibacillus litoralis JSM 072002]